MLEPHRRAHLRIWLMLMVALPLLLFAAFIARPRQGDGPAPQRLGLPVPVTTAPARTAA